MGLFGGSTKTTTKESFDTGPSSWQKGYLDPLFQGAKDAYDKAAGTPYYQGDLYAGMSPEAKSALDNLRKYASGEGLNAASSISNIGKSMAGYADKAGSSLDKYLELAGADNTDAIMSAAGKYADNPYLQAQIDGAAGDITRNLRENLLPSIDRSASASGNINSSRAGIASGIAQRGAAEEIAQIGANLRSQAWNNGLNMAQGDLDRKINAYGKAGDAYARLGSSGIDALAKGAQLGYDAYGQITGTYDREQADQQGELDAAYQKWQGQDQRDFDLLNRYANIVAGNQWGQSGTSTSTSKTKQSGGVLGGILGAVATGAGAYFGAKAGGRHDTA
ncbi:hypothetical protein [Caenibius sp. WL]|uniref:hypothetical protein n=1 Tax=Caenibius sp. WL TaxID=2872646 RepID=UPI001C9954C6|nr:hypothetical protein [Caenibius sp. WL]QZP08170.1 hypothetical protein K5X80_16305 [Caenibius sp. WL]